MLAAREGCPYCNVSCCSTGARPVRSTPCGVRGARTRQVEAWVSKRESICNYLEVELQDEYEARNQLDHNFGDLGEDELRKMRTLPGAEPDDDDSKVQKCKECGNANETEWDFNYKSGDVTCRKCGTVAVENRRSVLSTHQRAGGGRAGEQPGVRSPMTLLAPPALCGRSAPP